MPELSKPTKDILEIVNNVFGSGFNTRSWTKFYELLSEVPPEKQPIYLIGHVLAESKLYNDKYRSEFLKQLKTKKLFPLDMLGEIETIEKIMPHLKMYDRLNEVSLVDGQVSGMLSHRVTMQDKLNALQEITSTPAFIQAVTTPILFSKDPVKLAKELASQLKREPVLNKIPEAFQKCTSLLANTNVFDDHVDLFNQLLDHTELNSLPPCIASLLRTGLLNGPSARANFDRVLACDSIRSLVQCVELLNKTNLNLLTSFKAQENFERLLNHPELDILHRCIASLLETDLLNGPSAVENFDRVLACDHIYGLSLCVERLNKTSLLTSFEAQENFQRILACNIYRLDDCVKLLNKTNLLTSFEAQENFERLCNHHDLESLAQCLTTMVETGLLIDPRKSEEDEADEHPRLTRKFFSINEKSILQINRIPQKNFEALLAYPEPAKLTERLNATISQDDFEELCSQSSVTADFRRT